MTQHIEVDAGVDYITRSFTHEGPERQLYSEVTQWLHKRAKADGDQASPARRLGYDGWGGTHWFTGSHTQGNLVIVSSGLADQVCNLFPGLLTTPSRLDVQVSYVCSIGVKNRLNTVLKEVLKEREHRPKALKFRVDYWSDTDGINTVYVGSRTSAQFARIYDKHTQSPKLYPENTVRYEIQFTNEFAHKVAQSIYGIIQPSSLTARDIVWSWLADRGIDVPSDIIYSQIGLPRYDKQNTSDARKLAWFEKQVKPGVHDLLKRNSRGTILAALGLLELGDDEEVS